MFIIPFLLFLPFIFFAAKLFFKAMENKCCYMLNYECYKPANDDETLRKLTTESSARIVLRNTNLGLEQYRFLLQTIVNSGIGEETYCPKNVIAGHEQDPTLVDALEEMDDIFFQTIDNIFIKSGVSPVQIDILVVNVSLLSPAPSLTARIIHRYKMREDVKVFNLSGMGCSASLVAIDLVHQLFKIYPQRLALVVSTESLGPNWYCGKDKSFMLSNCLFRSGGCSMLLSNDESRKHKAILKLKQSVRTHIGANDEAYECCIQVEDKEGYRGFCLTKKLTKAAAYAFAKNLKVLVPRILPMWEILRYLFSARGKQKPTINLKTGVHHFCIHPGGRAVIDEVEKNLGLTEYDVEPARMALHRFGNTSAGGLWYVLGYMEAKKRLKRGDIILMISLGAGFKCNNCTWEVVGDMCDPNVWSDCLDRYPPASIVNPFRDKYGWINDERLSFFRLEDIFSQQKNAPP